MYNTNIQSDCGGKVHARGIDALPLCNTTIRNPMTAYKAVDCKRCLHQLSGAWKGR